MSLDFFVILVNKNLDNQPHPRFPFDIMWRWVIKLDKSFRSRLKLLLIFFKRSDLPDI